jgi:hypothetical protein
MPVTKKKLSLFDWTFPEVRQGTFNEIQFWLLTTSLEVNHEGLNNISCVKTFTF